MVADTWEAIPANLALVSANKSSVEESMVMLFESAKVLLTNVMILK